MDEASPPTSTPESRAAERRLRILGHRAQSFEAAERWDLDFWQSCTPQERLSAFADLRRATSSSFAPPARPQTTTGAAEFIP
jgi:hypothetical protein